MENEDQQFFLELLDRTGKAYESSEIKSRNLFYSVCATPIFKNTTLILGFNWGAGEGQNYEPQSKMETKPFTQLDLGSFRRTLNFFKQYLPADNLDELVQSNFCFFRSKKEKDISNSDLDLTMELFDSFIKYVSPIKVISFSGRLRRYFDEKKMLDIMDSTLIRSGTKEFYCAKAKLSINGNNIPIYFSTTSKLSYHIRSTAFSLETLF